MKLEVGKKYVCRNGEVVGPIELRPAHESITYKFSDPNRGRNDYSQNFWADDGSFNKYNGAFSPLDIVSEYTEPAPPLQWKWMKPDRPGIWVFGGYHKQNPMEGCGICTTVIQIESPIRDVEIAWYCFLCDIPVISPPEKKKVKKRLYVRRERAPLDCSPPEIEHRWEPVDAAVKLSEWKSTELIEEFLE